MGPRFDGPCEVQTVPRFVSEKHDTKASHPFRNEVKAINKKPFELKNPENLHPIPFASIEQSLQQGYYPIAIKPTNTGATSEPNMLKYINGFKLGLITKQGNSNCLNDWAIQPCISRPIQEITKAEVKAIVNTFNLDRVAGSIAPVFVNGKNFMPYVDLKSATFDFVYVTLLGRNGAPMTFLAAGMHAFTSGMSPFVLAAGEGFFTVAKKTDENQTEPVCYRYEIKLNNGSGAYCVTKNQGESSQEFQKRYSWYQQSALRALHLSMGIQPNNIIFDPAPIDKNPEQIALAGPAPLKKKAKKPKPLELPLKGGSSMITLRKLLLSPPTKIEKPTTDDKNNVASDARQQAPLTSPEKSKPSSFARLFDFLSPTKVDGRSQEKTPSIKQSIASCVLPSTRTV